MTEHGITTSKNMSSLEILMNIFTNPKEAYTAVKSNPTWLFPVILLIVLGVASTFFLADFTLEMQKKSVLQSERLTETQKDMFLEELENPSFMRQYGYQILGVIFYVFAGFSIAALAFMVVGNFILGGETKFRDNFALFAWGSCIGIVESLIKVPLMVSKNSIEVYTSLAIFMDAAESKTVLFKILNAVDVFAIWKIIVLSIGFGVIYNFSKGKSYGTVIALYILYTTIAIGISTLFGGMI